MVIKRMSTGKDLEIPDAPGLVLMKETWGSE